MAAPASIVLSVATFDGTNVTLIATVTDTDGNPYLGGGIIISDDYDFVETATNNNNGT